MIFTYLFWQYDDSLAWGTAYVHVLDCVACVVCVVMETAPYNAE